MTTTCRSTPGEMGVMIAIGVGVAGALLALAWVVGHAPQPATVDGNKQHDRAAQHGDGSPGPINGNPAAVPYEPRCRPPYSKDEDDLCQQRRMAKAAERSADIAEWQAWLSGGGVILLLWTIWFAAKSSRSAAAGVDVAQRTAKRQLRAYLNYEKATMSGFLGDMPELAIVIRNYGQTPARDVRFRIGIQIIEAAREDDVVAKMGYWQPYGVTAPQGKIEMFSSRETLKLSDRIKARVMNGSAVIILDGELKYVDVFCGEQTTTFRSAFGGPYRHREDGSLYICQTGNDAT